ncbi:MAG: hypothetical protein L6R28_24670, partial [Planctomycetes bacterium]|nr:hypothetical protein [Planctomycetota bacterium]
TFIAVLTYNLMILALLLPLFSTEQPTPKLFRAIVRGFTHVARMKRLKQRTRLGVRPPSIKAPACLLIAQGA